MLREMVTQWADEFEEVRGELGLTADRYPTALGLAFTAIESAGDPTARRPGSQFVGLLQQGRYASLDLGWEDRGRRTADRLHGNPVLAIRSWYQLMERYKDRWGYGEHPALEAAILWKGGAGTARRIRDKIQREGIGLYAACRWIETHENASWRIPNLTEYVRRMERFYAEAERFMEAYEREVVIEPPTPVVLTARPLFGVTESLLSLALRLLEMRRTGD